MKTGVLLATGAGLLALSVADAAYRTRNWGAADREVGAVLAGDELVPEPADSTTLAVSVAAPADEVWQALFATVSDRNPVRIVPGSSVVLAEGHLGTAETTAEVVRSFHVVPTAPNRCRLLARTRAARGNAAGRVAARAFDPVYVLMTRRLLLGVAGRAEHGAGPDPAAAGADRSVDVRETTASRG
jgi:hypothetical protein